MKTVKRLAILSMIAMLLVKCLPEQKTELIVTSVKRNYSKEFEQYAEWFQIPKEYLCALSAIEVSGRKRIPHRFEKHVYQKLVDLKNGKLDKFENITKQDLKDVSDDDLRKMAKSWGPFQLMGYKCFFLDLTVDELIKKSSFYGAQWIDLSYGDLLRKGDFVNAFHLHNTGKLLPKDGKPITYDPNYIKKGLLYLEIFKRRGTNPEKKDSININFNNSF